MATQPVGERDYFTDHSVLLDPYRYFDEVRANGPVFRSKHHDVVIVTGHQEAVDVLRNTEDFSSTISTGGPVIPLPFEPQGADITDQIETHRLEMPGTNLLVAQDGARHANARALLVGLFTPSRLRANEDFMKTLANQMVADVVSKGGCDLVKEVATPFVTLVVANLLDVPADDRAMFRAMLDEAPPVADVNNVDDKQGAATLGYALERMGQHFAGYVMDRRANPRADVLSELANAKYPDGTTPELIEIVTLAVFLFAAGGDTSAKLLSNSTRILCEDPELQRRLRADYSLIPAFLEEVLRIEGSTKMTARLAKRRARVGDLEVKPGERIAILLSATSHDERRWPDPKDFIIGRPKINEHLAFARGKHTCVGAPLARLEVRLMLESLFNQTSDISLSEKHHGPAGDRKLDYEPSFIIRGLNELHVELTPA
jgi:cytochrome P450